MLDFYRGKRVLITGHTGFKGAWLSRILHNAGAQVTGYALPPPTDPSLFCLLGLDREICSVMGDIRDFAHLLAVFREAKPEIVFHLAAQPLVRESYRAPRDTYEINLMGTVNVLECLRRTDTARSFINVTTDKVYENREWVWGYRENDPLNGFDPYSNSKSCSELITKSYKSAFFADRRVALSTVRAGNVIGGGDFATDRIIPDCVRAALQGAPVTVRNPHSTRPYQHVLESLFAYLMLAARQYEEPCLGDAYNVGPDDCDCLETGELVALFANIWGSDFKWEATPDNGPHESGLLKLDSVKLKQVLGWRPTLHLTEAMRLVVEWTKIYEKGGDVGAQTDRQITAFYQDFKRKQNGGSYAFCR